MARGFESKDVEFQQAEAERQKGHAEPPTAEERDALERMRTLELALTRAEAVKTARTVPAIALPWSVATGT